MNHTSEKNWVISPETSILDVKLNELYEYRDLLWLLVRRDFVSFYKQTVLGPVWFFIQPIFTVVIYSIIFGRVGGFSTDGIPKPLFYLAGVITWNYFSECLIKTSMVFKDNAEIFGKVYFPRLIMPLSIVFSNLVRFGVQLILFFAMLTYFLMTGYHLEVTFYIFLFPILIILMAGLGLGLGMIISALTTKYRDLAFLIQFGVPLLMYTTTVVYPLSSAPAEFKWLVELNPMTAIIETFRVGFFGHGSFTWSLLGFSSAFTVIVIIFGTFIFNKVEKSFVDTI